MQFYENLLGRRAAGRSVILSAGHQALAARSSIQLRLVPSPREVFVGVGVCGSMSVQQVSGVPWGWHRGAKMRFELEWGGSWDRASAERSAIAACQRRTRKGRDGRGRSRLRCHRHLFADFLAWDAIEPHRRAWRLDHTAAAITGCTGFLTGLTAQSAAEHTAMPRPC